jgi:hypothetical protein
MHRTSLYSRRSSAGRGAQQARELRLLDPQHAKGRGQSVEAGGGGQGRCRRGRAGDDRLDRSEPRRREGRVRREVRRAREDCAANLLEALPGRRWRRAWRRRRGAREPRRALNAYFCYSASV